MAEYLVLDANPQAQRVALLDRLRRYCVATAVGAVPSPGTALHGPPLAQGVAYMSDPAHDRVYRLTFQAARCTQDETLLWLRSSSRPGSD